MHSISGREGFCIRAFTVGCRTQELPFPMSVITAYWLLPGDSRIRVRGRENTSGGGEARFCLYLRMWSDYFSPVPSLADNSLPGGGLVERDFSPQIFGNKVRYNDCASGSSLWSNWDSIPIYLGIYRPFFSSVPRDLDSGTKQCLSSFGDNVGVILWTQSIPELCSVSLWTPLDMPPLRFYTASSFVGELNQRVVTITAWQDNCS